MSDVGRDGPQVQPVDEVSVHVVPSADWSLTILVTSKLDGTNVLRPLALAPSVARNAANEILRRCDDLERRQLHL
jgi:hypothetical protein